MKGSILIFGFTFHCHLILRLQLINHHWFRQRLATEQATNDNRKKCCPSQLTHAWWRHQMETFSALLAICVGNSPVTSEFPAQRQWPGALIFSLICAWISGWVINGEAGVLRRNHAYYDVTVMVCIIWPFLNENHCNLTSLINFTLFGEIKCTLTGHWFRQWLGTQQTINHYID